MMMGAASCCMLVWLVAERGVAVSYETCITRKLRKLAPSNQRSSPADHVSKALCQHHQVLFDAQHYPLASSVPQGRRSSCRSCRDPQRRTKTNNLPALCSPAALSCGPQICFASQGTRGDPVIRRFSSGLIIELHGVPVKVCLSVVHRGNHANQSCFEKVV
jgi:hypothetical protein